MPKIGKPVVNLAEVLGAVLTAAGFPPDARSEFLDPDKWVLSRKKNLWRKYLGKTLTIFPDERDGGFSWCIATEYEVRYSPNVFDTEEEAKADLAREMGVES